MLETHHMSFLICCLVLILVFCLARTLVLCLALFHVLFSQFSYGPNHCSYGFRSRENRFEPRCFGCGPRPHRGDRFLHRPGFPAGGSFPHLELRHLDGSHFSRRGSCPTRPSGEVQKIVKTSSGRMVKCSIPKIYLTNPITEPLTFSRPV
jgi:hypothetical protein